jgi:large subunit ribosomal protein L13
MKSTYFPQKGVLPDRRWHVVDANGQVLGRLATRIAGLLRGKGKPTFTPYLDEGDFVIVINAAQVKLTGKKLDQKVAYSHSLYPGGLKLVPYSRLMVEHPERAVEKAVSNMLCKNKLRAQMLTRLKIYRDAAHPHAAQKPQVLALS